MNISRLSSFSDGNTGGNPAGVHLAERHPSVEVMQSIAAEVGFSETAFAMPANENAWRVRYFSPKSEVPFCGHATIALGAALARKYGDGLYKLILNDAEISVEGQQAEDAFEAALQSPPTYSKPAPQPLTDTILQLFGYTKDQLDQRIPPAIVHGGAQHFALTLNSREALANMRYDFSLGEKLMREHGLVTIMLAFPETNQRFHTRNPFAFGGVYEDPATGAASAAYAGYLRDIGWPHAGQLELLQGFDMGQPSRIFAAIPNERGSSIRVSGRVREMEA